MNLLYSTLKKSLFWLLTKDIEESRAGGGVDQESQEHNTRYMDQDLQVKIKVQVTQNLINGLKSMDKNVTDYDTIESETTGTCYSEHREHQIQVLLRWYARWEKTTENCVIWFIQGLTRYIPVTTKTQLSGNVSVCTPLHLTCSEYRPSTHPDADSLRVNLIVMGHL